MSMLLAGLIPVQVLLADGDMKALIQIIVFILILAFSGITQLVKWLKKQQQPGPRPGPQAERPAGQQELMNEVEEFLRRASQGGDKPAAQQPQPQQRSRQERVKQRPAKSAEPAKKTSRAQRPLAQPRVDVVAAEVVDEPLARRHLAPGLQDHISQRNLEQRQGSMAAHEQQFSSKIEATFQHSVGGLSAQLGDSTVESATPAPSANQGAPADSPAAEMLALLQSQAGIRQAVLLNEVLQRPTQRWQ